MNKYNKQNLHIDPMTFQHPKNTALGNQLVENNAFKKVLEFISKNSIERSLRGLYLSSFLKATASTAPNLIRMRDEACELFGVEKKPEIFLYRDYSAVTTLKGIDNPMILMSTELINVMSEQALWGIVASSVSAIRTDYCSIRMVEETLSFVKMLVPDLFVSALSELITRWRASAQFSFDRAALMATGEFNIAMQGILAGEMPRKILENIDFSDPDCGYMKQCLRYFSDQGFAMKVARSADTVLEGTAPYASRYLELYNFYKNDFFDLMDEYSEG